MSRTFISLVIAAALFPVVLGQVPRLAAEEQHAQFLEGLRQRQYYDLALYHLDVMEKQADLPAEVKQIIPFERAITLLDGARFINNTEVREEQLDRAVGQLEAFTKANPRHELAARANSEQARILIEKARVKIWDSQSPANEDNQDKFRLEARGLLTKAREIFQTAHDLYKTQFDKFPPYIDPSEKEQLEARGKAEIDYMRAQLDLASCTYEDAQTHKPGSTEYKNLLTKAADEFKDIHERYRSIVGGLYARMWQGKCFEEQEDIGKALGIYNELLQHPGKSKAMQTVQDQVLQFRLICLNDDQRKDYQLVINEAGQWITANRSKGGTRVGLGIRYEKAVAHEKLAAKIETEKGDKKDVERNLRLAINEAQGLTNYSGQYKAASQFMVSRLKGKLGLGQGDPKTIEEALVVADKMVQDIEPLEAEIEAAKSKTLPKQEIAKRQEELDAHLAQTSAMLDKALKLANETTETTLINKARFWLAYIYYKLGRNYEAGVLGEFIANRYAKDDTDSQLAEQAANVAMAAYHQAYEARSKEQEHLAPDQRDVNFELDQMVRTCENITRLWPGSGLADTSRMTLGRIYSRRDKPVEAAGWFTQVASSALYPQAQVSAGQAYWNAYLKAAVLPEDKRPKAEDLAAWQTNSKKHLEVGIQKMTENTPENAEVDKTTDLIAGKVTLAQIYANEQQYDQAIDLLTKPKHAPLEAIKLKEGEARPAVGIKSQSFARLVFQILLRAYVGKQQTDAALNAMKDLEAVIGTEGDELTRTYVELGTQIRAEVERLQAEGPEDRLQAILQSFNAFLNALLAKKAEMSDGSLQWMAETFLNLGISLKDNPNSNATDYFKKAADSYQTLIDRAAKEAEPPPWLVGIKLRLANTSRSAGDYDNALATLEDVLKTYPRSLETQTEAAALLQDWGASGRQDSPTKLLEAIRGRKLPGDAAGAPPGLWGWGGLTQQLIGQLRPVRATVRELQTQLDTIYAYEAILKKESTLQTELETLGTEATPEDRKALEEQLAILNDAEAATKQWLALRSELRSLEHGASRDKAKEKARLARIEEINRQLSRLVDTRYFLDQQQKRDELKQNNEAADKIAAIEQELALLRPAWNTSQRLLKVRERLYVRLQQAYEGHKKTLLGSSPTREMDDLKAQMDAIRPDNVKPAHLGEVAQELAALAEKGQAPTKEQLSEELGLLRDAVNAWTAYELVQASLPVSLSELTLDNEQFQAEVQQKKAQLIAELKNQEARETATHEKLLDTLYHVSESRHHYAEVQSSTPEKTKALQTAKIETANLTRIIPRENVSDEWWNKFNALYKTIQTELNPLVPQAERTDPPQEIPVPETVDSNRTWLERESVVAVASSAAGDAQNAEEAAAQNANSFPLTWLILALLLALGATGAVVYFTMSAQKKPARINYGASPLRGNGVAVGEDAFAFLGESVGGEAKTQRARPRPTKPAASGASRPSSTNVGEATRPSGSALKKRPPAPRPTGEAPKPRPPKPRPTE